MPANAVNERDHHDHHYATLAERGRSALFERVHDRSVRQFLRGARVGGAQRVLSLGCGDGAIERRLAPHVGTIVGLDISAVAIGQARAAGETAGLRNLSFLEWQPGSRPLEEFGRFDVVAAFAFLHHLQDAALREVLVAARAAVKPGGLFYSTDPSCRRLVRLFAGVVREAYARHHSPDERELDPDALAQLAREAGFLQPEISYTDYFLGPLAWLAPRTPEWLAGPLEFIDNLALRVPLARRYASSFCLLARAPGG